MTSSTIQSDVLKLLPEAEKFLCDLISYPSTPGQEQEVMEYIYEQFQNSQTRVEKIHLTNDLKNDPDYSDPIPSIEYDGRFNLRISRGGGGGGKTLLFNAHSDVVPASEGMTHAFSPIVKDGIVFGRGACDDKGQIATLFLVLKVIESMNINLKGDLVFHVVVEEENGGNGSLAMIRQGENADGCIVMEASGFETVFTSIRGAVWFKITFRGQAGHSGMPSATKSALLLAREAMGILEQYHVKLLKESRGLEYFDEFINPMPLTFGHLEAGNWPAAAPNLAVLEGVLGLLPNKTKEEVCREFEQALIEGGLQDQFDLHFMYRHDSSVLDPDHDIPRLLVFSANEFGHQMNKSAMTASCDAWFYNNILKIPTVVYGPGSLRWAHSIDEQIKLSEIAQAAEILTRFIISYCKVD